VRKLKIWLILIPIFVVVFDMGFFAASLLPLPVDRSEIPQVDLIVALTGGQGRLKEALAFLEENRGKYLLISGVPVGLRLDSILKANGVANFPAFLQNRILLGNESDSTFENAIEVREVAERVSAHSLVIVTSNYHMRRALRLIRSEFAKRPRLEVPLYSYPVESRNFEARSWWWSPTSWSILLWEYVKSLPVRWGLTDT